MQSLKGSGWIHDSLLVNNHWSSESKFVEIAIRVLHDGLVFSHFNLVFFLCIDVGIANNWTSKLELIEPILVVLSDCSSVLKFGYLILKSDLFIVDILKVVLKNFSKVVVLSNRHILLHVLHVGALLHGHIVLFALEKAHLFLAHLSVELCYVLRLTGTHLK